MINDQGHAETTYALKALFWQRLEHYCVDFRPISALVQFGTQTCIEPSVRVTRAKVNGTVCYTVKLTGYAYYFCIMRATRMRYCLCEAKA